MKIVYKSDDGKEFNTQDECKNYENRNISIKLAQLVSSNCDTDYEDDYTANTISKFILDNIEQINNLISEKE